MSRLLMFVKTALLIIGLGCGATFIGCSTVSTAPAVSSVIPTMPSAFPVAGSDVSRVLDTSHSGSSHGLQLTAVTGSGSGVVNVTATAIGGVYTLNTQDSIHVQ